MNEARKLHHEDKKVDDKNMKTPISLFCLQSFCRLLLIALPVTLHAADTPHFKETQVHDARRVVAVENACAWPNLTLLPGGTVVAILCGAAMFLREAIEKSSYGWKHDDKNIAEAMMAIFQKTGVPVEDAATKTRYRRLALMAALQLVMRK